MYCEGFSYMTEQTFTTKLTHWLRNFCTETCAFEVKITKEKSVPFDVLKEHQKHALEMCALRSVAYKIPDSGYQNPFDGVFLRACPAYVVIYFDKKGNKEFFMIPIEDWLEEERTSTRKSITESRCRDLGYQCFL